MSAQREMFFPWLLKQPQRAPQEVIDSFKCYRDAVVWAWENRVNQGCGEKVDQAIFANWAGMHTPHMSRCVNRDSKAPMKLDPDLVPQFEQFTGWLAISQFACKGMGVTPMEWVLEDRRVA